MTRAALAVAVLAAALPAAAGRSEVTPVQKVIQMLTGMVEKGKKEKHAEKVQFQAYKEFCDLTQEEKQWDIEDANEKITTLTADIEKYGTDSTTLGEQIAKHDEDIATWGGDFKAASKVRETEHFDYDAVHNDYTESIQALHDGIRTIKNQDKEAPSAGDAAQDLLAEHAAKLEFSQLAALTKPVFPKEAKRIMDSFLAQDPDTDSAKVDSALGLITQATESGFGSGASQAPAPQAAAYEFESGGIIDMLQKLITKFEDERDQIEKEEINAKFSYTTLVQDLKAQMSRAEEQRTAKAATKAQTQEASAGAKEDLSDTTTTRDDDAKYLSDLTATCELKAEAFAEREKLRTEEIAAVEKAVEILASGAVSGAADKHLPALVQKPAALIQLRSGAARGPENRFRVAEFLKDRATSLDSHILAALATKVEADPFKKVSEMIKNLIVKLMDEANDEASHKMWCDTETAQNDQTRREKTEGVEVLTAHIEELSADMAKLGEEIAELTKSVAALDAAVEKATVLRNAEGAKNTETIREAQEAQTAVAQALSVLKEFYDKAADATSLVQQEPLEEPEVFDEPYKGMSAENGGVMGMIEVIQSDFARLESETSAAEAEAQKEYDEFMNDSSVNKAQMESDIEHKGTKKMNEEQALEEAKTDLDGTQKELDSALGYWEKLKPTCTVEEESYETRVARRKDELESLQEALKILDGESV